LEGVLSADEEINQQDLANRLGVSRSPVRDALREWAWSPSTPISKRW